MTKKCSKCKDELPTSSFSRSKAHSGGLYPQCKRCTSEWAKQHYRKNRRKIIDRVAEYRVAHRDKVLESKRREYRRHKEKYVESNRAWVEKNREASNNYKYKYKQKRRSADPSYRVVDNLRSRIRAVLKGENKSEASMQLIGCSPEALRQHLESQFDNAMTWDNYGPKGWHIDHIIPCASFDLSDPEQQKKCFHYTNLQPMWAKDNLSKGSKLV